MRSIRACACSVSLPPDEAGLCCWWMRRTTCPTARGACTPPRSRFPPSRKRAVRSPSSSAKRRSIARSNGWRRRLPRCLRGWNRRLRRLSRRKRSRSRWRARWINSRRIASPPTARWRGSSPSTFPRSALCWICTTRSIERSIKAARPRAPSRSIAPTPRESLRRSIKSAEARSSFQRRFRRLRFIAI